jgi:hypothetical protein
MKRDILIAVAILLFITKSAGGSPAELHDSYRFPFPDDSIRNSLILYNGRIWQDLFYMIEGDQFLFTKEFMPGTLTMSGKTFRNIRLKVDIFNDEVLIPVPGGGILQVNKEMVDSFLFVFQNKTYRFVKAVQEKSAESSGYLNVLFSGKTALCIKYYKKTEPPGGEGELDRFYQGMKIIVVKDAVFTQVKNRKDLLMVLNDHREELNSYIKKNHIAVSAQDPESFIPVIRYYEQISN